MKFILISAFVLTSLIANAQFVKGDKYIGGTFSFNAQNSSGSDLEAKSKSCAISPALGFFLNDKYAVGGGIGYSYYHQTFEAEPDFYQEGRTNSIRVHAFVERYFKISEQFVFKMNGSLSYGRERQKQEDSTTEVETKNYSVGINVRPSLLFLPSPRWGIEAGIGDLGLTHWRSLSNDAKSTSVYLNYGTFSLGFAYYFRTPSE